MRSKHAPFTALRCLCKATVRDRPQKWLKPIIRHHHLCASRSGETCGKDNDHHLEYHCSMCGTNASLIKTRLTPRATHATIKSQRMGMSISSASPLHLAKPCASKHRVHKQKKDARTGWTRNLPTSRTALAEDRSRRGPLTPTIQSECLRTYLDGDDLGPEQERKRSPHSCFDAQVVGLTQRRARRDSDEGGYGD